MMKYKGYVGNVGFDDEANIFHGDVINLRDVITFQGETVDELRKAFQESIDDYLEFCAERGDSPEKPYSGKFLIRIEPKLHKAAALRATLMHKSFNTWIHDTLETAVEN